MFVFCFLEGRGERSPTWNVELGYVEFIFGDINSCIACCYFVLRAYVEPGTAKSSRQPYKAGPGSGYFLRAAYGLCHIFFVFKNVKKTFLARGLSRNRPPAGCGGRAVVCSSRLRYRPAQHPTVQTGNRDCPAYRWATCRLTTTLPMILATTSLCFYPLPCSNFDL